MRKAIPADVDLFFHWANDKESRENSYSNAEIAYDDHVKWFSKRLGAKGCSLYVFTDEYDTPVGQVRIEENTLKSMSGQWIISISVDRSFRGKNLSSEMISTASKEFMKDHRGEEINALIFKSNIPSYKSFLKAGYTLRQELVINGVPSFVLSFMQS